MPIKIPNSLPAAHVLESENIFVMDAERAYSQDIRPLRLLILNLMPNKSVTETQLLRLLGNTPLQVEVDFIYTESYVPQHTSQDYLTEFYGTFAEVRHKKYDVPGIVIPYSDNAYNNQDIAENVYYYIITQAKRYVHITTPYVIIDNQMMNALIFAARRGVDVTLIVPRTIDHFITFCTGRVFINTLVENGVRVYEFTPGFIHAKMFISDDTTAVVGSVNLDYRSLFDQFEDAAFIYKHPVVAEIEADFQKTKAQSSEITKQTYKNTPVHRRIIGRIFRVFAPLL